MSEPHSPQSPNSGNPTQQNPSGQDPYGGKKPQKDPCDDPKPPADATYPPDKPPCPPPEDPCPPPKPCPERPTPPCPPPDPCGQDDKPPYEKPGDKAKEPYGEDSGDQSNQADYPGTPQKPGDDSTPGKAGDYPGRDDTGNGGKPPDEYKKPCGDRATGTGGTGAGGPAAHLAALKARLETEQKELQRFEPLKTSIADLTQRIATLEKAVEGQATASTAYKDFYRTTEVALHELQLLRSRRPLSARSAHRQAQEVHL